MDVQEITFKFQTILLLSYFTTFSSFVESIVYGDYTQTNIIHNTCMSETLSTSKVRRLFDCGQVCINEMECRRILYCTSDSTCTLFRDGTDCIMKGDSKSCVCYRKNIGCNETACTCPLGYFGDGCKDVVEDCEEAKAKKISPVTRGLTYIKPNISVESFEVLCVFGSGVTTILRRVSACKHESFNRSLSEYEEGFGSVPDNRWIGFNKLLKIMNSKPHSNFRLQFFRSFSNVKCHVHYTDLKIGDKASGYTFRGNLSMPGGNLNYCGDSMLGSLNLYGRPFSTYDFDHTGTNNCPAKLGGGWWFDDSPNCTRGFLTGTMDGSGIDNFWLDNLSGLQSNWMVFNLRRF